MPSQNKMILFFCWRNCKCCCNSCAVFDGVSCIDRLPIYISSRCFMCKRIHEDLKKLKHLVSTLNTFIDVAACPLNSIFRAPISNTIFIFGLITPTLFNKNKSTTRMIRASKVEEPKHFTKYSSSQGIK